jgi:hypothetical protein
MKKIINLILLFVTICSFAQTNNKSYDFQFYKNGNFRNSKNLKIQIVKNSDSIACEVLNKKIIIPEIKDSCTVFFKIKNKKYIINNVDFSKLDSNSKIIFGIESNIKNFESISNQNPNFYILKNASIGVLIEILEQTKEVNFIVFTSKIKTGNNKETIKSYTQYFFVK